MVEGVGGFRKAGFHTCIMAHHNMIMMDSQKLVIFFKYWYILFGELSQWGVFQEGE
jgi:hypothetical protein